MKDNDIIKALECCSHEYSWQKKCFDCEYAAFEGQCGNELIKDALNLINRQKAEIEKLTAMVEAAEDYLNPLPFKNAFDEEIEKAKSEAIKEFAEKLKSEINELEAKSPNKAYQTAMEDMLTYYFPKIIDKCLGEMVGDES